MVGDSTDAPMRSGLLNHVLFAAFTFLAGCQSPSANHGTQSNIPGLTTEAPTTPSSQEVDSFDLYHREPGVGLHGSSYFGRGP
jgi:hypothetical protein